MRSPSRASKATRVPDGEVSRCRRPPAANGSAAGASRPSAAASGIGRSHRSSGARSLRPTARTAERVGQPADGHPHALERVDHGRSRRRPARVPLVPSARHRPTTQVAPARRGSRCGRSAGRPARAAARSPSRRPARRARAGRSVRTVRLARRRRRCGRPGTSRRDPRRSAGPSRRAASAARSPRPSPRRRAARGPWPRRRTWICDVSRSGSRCDVTAMPRPSGDQAKSSTSTPGRGQRRGFRASAGGSPDGRGAAPARPRARAGPSRGAAR